MEMEQIIVDLVLLFYVLVQIYKIYYINNVLLYFLLFNVSECIMILIYLIIKLWYNYCLMLDMVNEVVFDIG